MNGSITFYPTAADEPRISMPETSGHLNLNDRGWSPSLLIKYGDQDYLRRLAVAATELADLMDAADDDASRR